MFSPSTSYPLPPGVTPIPLSKLDLRPDPVIDAALQNPPPVTSPKNIWFFWDTGCPQIHPYGLRNLRTWHRRFSPLGWTIRVVDLVPGSPSHISNFIDVSSPSIVPDAFRQGTLDGEFRKQHYSDLVRLPLLLAHGGVYADVGYMQIGDLDRLWEETIADPESPYEVLSFNAGGPGSYSLMNFFMGGLPGNAFWKGCHELLLRLWEGRTNTLGLHAHPLLAGLPGLGETFRQAGEKGLGRELTDYIIQGQAITMVMSTVDEERGWDGPAYVAEKVFAPEYLVGSQLPNVHTNWDGRKAFELLSLKVPEPGEDESDDQRLARSMVEDCFKRGFGFKLAHGLIVQVFGPTLGSFWGKNVGSDNVEGTYAHWLRYGMERWNQDALPETEVFDKLDPVKIGSLVRTDV